MKYTEKKALYESIMKEVGRIVKSRINNNVNEGSVGKIDYLEYIDKKYGQKLVNIITDVLYGIVKSPAFRVTAVVNILKELGDSFYNDDYERIEEISSFCSEHRPKK